MLQQDQEFITIIAAGTIMLLLLGFFIVSFLFFYQKKHNAHLAEQELIESNFQKELLKTQIEVQEQTFTDISREMHDNIGQILSFVKLNLAFSERLSDADKQAKISESRELLSQAIVDLRHLSKSMSFEYIASQGLVKTVENEVERIKRSNLINASLKVEGSPAPLGAERELVLFRIFQETLNNTLKHSGAKNLSINLQYSDDLFNLTLEDDGSGFATYNLPEATGSGLRNMQNRAALIGALTTIDSSPGNGCRVNVSLALIKNN
jgi:signal transduction histidine kinase